VKEAGAVVGRRAEDLVARTKGVARRVRRLGRRVLPAWFAAERPAGPPDPGGAGRRRAERLAEALGVVREIEQREAALPRTAEPQEFLTLDRAVRRPTADPALQSMLPAPLRGHWDPERSTVGAVRARVAADVIVLAKFDLGTEVKLRAAYGGQRRTVAVQPVRPNGTCGITNAVRSHEIVDRYAPGLMPELLGHGELSSGLRYLVERWVDGDPLTTRLRMAEHLPQIIEGLSRVHLGYGVHARRASEIWHTGFREQWQEVRAAGLVAEEAGAHVADLLAADKRLRLSWSHGDLVASNVLGTDDGVVVIDWEHAMERPVMHDAAKLHLFAADKDPLLDLLLDEWGDPKAAEGYTAAEELAVVHARFLSRAPVRMAELAGHRRQGVYARQVARQAALLADTLQRVA